MSDPPRPSATMCVVHQGKDEFEVLMVRRGATARFMAGAWVFPGGVVDPDDHVQAATIEAMPRPELGPWLAAGFREVAEETGIWLTEEPFVAKVDDSGVFAETRRLGLRFTADRTAYFANWITPTMVPVRFDARFFLAAIDEKLTPVPDRREIDAAEFVVPREALRRAELGEWLVPFPTQRTLRQLAEFASVAAALEQWRDRRVVAVQPRMRVADDGSLEVVMPGDPGFDDLIDAEPDAEVLHRAARAAAVKGQPVAEVVRDPD